MNCSSTITTDQNIQAIERIVMRDRHIAVRSLAYELAISTITTTVYVIMSNHLGLKKVIYSYLLTVLIMWIVVKRVK